MPARPRHRALLLCLWLITTVAIILWIWQPPSFVFQSSRAIQPVLAIGAAWILITLLIAKRLKQRPPESNTTVIFSALICIVAMVFWLPQAPRLLRELHIWSGLPRMYSPRQLPQYALALLLYAAPLSIAGILSLSFWLTRVERLYLSACSTVAGASAIGIAFHSPLAQTPTGLLFMIPWFCGHAITLLAWAASSRPYTNDWMFKCRGCGYELKGLESSLCPECGREVPRYQRELIGIPDDSPPENAPAESQP